MFFVAELSANHNGSLDRALAIVEAAAKAGANAIKLQTWLPDSMCLNPSIMETWNGIDISLVDLYRKAHTKWEWHRPIFDYAASLGLEAFSTPFDTESVDFLESLNCPRYKIASNEINDLPLIRYVAKTSKPIILSNGVATHDELYAAIDAIDEIHRSCNINTTRTLKTILKCVSDYPPKPENMLLYEITQMHARFANCIIGFSDHTLGHVAAVIATTLHARIIEKHIRLDDGVRGVDSHFSATPEEFKKMVDSCQEAEKMLSPKQPHAFSTRLKRSLFFVRDLCAGHKITKEDIRSARPNLGLPPETVGFIIGNTLLYNVKRGDPVLSVISA